MRYGKILRLVEKFAEKVSGKSYTLYHGSSFDFDFFKAPEKSSLRGMGVFFSDSIKYAKEFGNIIYKCKVGFRKPKEYDDSLEFEIDAMKAGGIDNLYYNLKENNYDGIIIKKSKVSTGRVLEVIKFDLNNIEIIEKSM
jgi:hypothetical protein